MSAKHTPGPWVVNTIDYTNSIGIECTVNGIMHTVCTDQFCWPNFQHHGSEEKLANARLIAAAPELLDALQRIMQSETLPKHLSDYADAAIKKATE